MSTMSRDICLRCLATSHWWRGQDLNLRPSGYEPDEYLQLRDIGVPRISLGSSVEGLDNWSYLEDDEIADSDTFTRYFAGEVT